MKEEQGMSILIKLLIGLGVIVVGSVGFVGLYFGASFLQTRAEPEIHLIAEGYRGPVLIAHSRPEGSAKKYEGDARVYEIPADGVLVTQFDANEGISYVGDQRFFYVTKDGRRIEVYEHLRFGKELPKDSLQVYGYSFGRQSFGSGDDLVYTDFMIGAPVEETEQVAFRNQKYMDSVMDAIRGTMDTVSPKEIPEPHPRRGLPTRPGLDTLKKS